MDIQQMLLDINPYSRPGTKIGKIKASANHYTGNQGSTAINNRNYFNNLQTTKKAYASAHYIIGLQGEIIRCIPEDEISYCTNSANSYSISIECCHPDATGKLTEVTYKSLVWLNADICKRHGLNPLNGGMIRHYDVTGKICPKWFVDNSTDWEKLKDEVSAAMKQTGWIKDDTGYWYLYEDGTYATRWQKIDGVWYFFYDNGYMVAGDWFQDKGKWYYLNKNGSLFYGWLLYQRKWCYLDKRGDPEGSMVIGFKTIDGADYYFGDDGYMVAEKFTVIPDAKGVLQIQAGSK